MRQVQTKRQPSRMGFFALTGLLGLLMASAVWAADSVSIAAGANHQTTPSAHTSWYILCSAQNVAANEDIYDANIMILESGGWVEYDTETTVTKVPGRVGSSYGYNVTMQDPHDHHFTYPATGAVWVKVRTYFSVGGVPVSPPMDSNELWRGCE